MVAERGFCQPKAETVRSIRESYGLKLRGKTLYSLLSQLLSAKDRAAKFSMAALIEVSLTMERNPDYLLKLADKIRNKLNPQTELILKDVKNPETENVAY
jgi:hypothetical protein